MNLKLKVDKKIQIIIESRLRSNKIWIEYKDTRDGVKLEVELKIDDMELEYEIHIRKDGNVRKIL